MAKNLVLGPILAQIWAAIIFFFKKKISDFVSH